MRVGRVWFGHKGLYVEIKCCANRLEFPLVSSYQFMLSNHFDKIRSSVTLAHRVYYTLSCSHGLAKRVHGFDMWDGPSSAYAALVDGVVHGMGAEGQREKQARVATDTRSLNDALNNDLLANILQYRLVVWSISRNPSHGPPFVCNLQKHFAIRVLLSLVCQEWRDVLRNFKPISMEINATSLKNLQEQLQGRRSATQLVQVRPRNDHFVFHGPHMEIVYQRFDGKGSVVKVLVLPNSAWKKNNHVVSRVTYELENLPMQIYAECTEKNRHMFDIHAQNGAFEPLKMCVQRSLYPTTVHDHLRSHVLKPGCLNLREHKVGGTFLLSGKYKMLKTTRPFPSGIQFVFYLCGVKTCSTNIIRVCNQQRGEQR